MAPKDLVVALTLAVATLPLPATNPATTGAPAGSPETRYCLRVDPATGSRIETIQCRTREEWAQLDVDVDQEWRDNGVKIIA